MKSSKPIPKPRKSLMNMNNTAILGAEGALLKGHLNESPTTGEDSTKDRRFDSECQRPQASPPPLPPRPSIDLAKRPLPPIPAGSRTVSQMDFIDNVHQMDWAFDENSVTKLYPPIDQLLSTNFPLQETIHHGETTVLSVPSATINECSYHAMLSSPISIEVTEPTSSTTPYISFCEPFGADVKSDGESICFSGWVQIPNGQIRLRRRGWAFVRNNAFSIGQDDESCTCFYGPVEMSRCIFLGRVTDSNKEIALAIHSDLDKDKNRKPVVCINEGPLNILRFSPEENHEYWLALLAKSCAPRNDIFQAELPMVDCCGKLWIKQGISGHWNEGWAYVHNHILYYWVQVVNAVAEIDIRKIFLVKQTDIPLSDWCNRIDHSSSGPLLIALEGSSLYLQSEYDQCTNMWLKFLTAELRKEAGVLEDCRLTSDDVPVIVDKCIALICTYGMFQPGIYRKNGSAAEAKRIIQSFREDPYTVHLKPPISDETVNAVADVLRTFFRQLKAPLIPVSMHSSLFEIANASQDSKANLYQELICTLPKVHYRTLKKLLGHLEEIVSHEDLNLASLDNISKIFGPTLFNTTNSEEQISVEFYNTTTKQALVLHDLIYHYCEIFGVNAEELLTKCKLDVLRDQKVSKNPATGLLIPIHLFEKDNKCFNVQAEWTASQVVSFKIQKLSYVSPYEAYALFEMLKGGELERRISANETLRSIVLGRWLDWEEHQSNFLLLKRDTYPFQPQSGRAFAENLKIAEPGSRNFKSASLRIEDGVHVCHYSKSMKKQSQWKVDEILWFAGVESERKCPHPHALTFFVSNEKKGSSCKGRLPGYCVAFKDELQRLQWLNQVIVSAQEYLPMPIIQI